MILQDADVRIPKWVVDFDSFRRWATSDKLPQHGWYSHLNGELWVDTSMERHNHNQLRAVFGAILTTLVYEMQLGYLYPDRMLLTNRRARLSTEPDMMFVSWDTIRLGRVKVIEGKTTEILGTPDMTLEVVSKASVRKDTVVLRKLYHRAGVLEYWLVDSRPQNVEFTLFRHTADGYAPARKYDGWVKSSVFGKSFRFTQDTDRLGNAQYRLEVR